jgi:uncharacterized protein involved in exopolysaccharide biosynthesis
MKQAYNSAVIGVASSADANPNPNPNRIILRVPSQRKQFDVQVNQAILTSLIQNLEAAKVTLRKETPLFLEIDRPLLPLESEDPRKLRAFILGGFLGGLLAVILLVVTRFMTNLAI